MRAVLVSGNANLHILGNPLDVLCVPVLDIWVMSPMRGLAPVNLLGCKRGRCEEWGEQKYGE